MKFRALGPNGPMVSQIALGTMTWGQQNTEQEAHEQLDVALAAGVNLIDTAEMYPVPPKPETAGRTETMIGTWLARQPSRRDQMVLATKAAGPSRTPTRPAHIRDGRLSFNATNLTEAVNDSLRRLQTDYIDLYQLHWPDRSTNCFGQMGYEHVDGEETVSIEETLDALGLLVQAGKIRQIGVSNETPWGVARFLQAAAHQSHAHRPRIVSIQNPYSLVNRIFEIGLAEFSSRDGVGLLAYSPLAFGWLSGKYLDGARPAGARITLFERFTRYNSPSTQAAVGEYVDLFRRHGIDPAQGALAYVNSRPFLTSNIIGATSLEQLEANIASIELELPTEVIAGIESIHQRMPNPAP
jgi:aryl-alcohol dehydrogenase-like predicted oxidoreductase